MLCAYRGCRGNSYSLQRHTSQTAEKYVTIYTDVRKYSIDIKKKGVLTVGQRPKKGFVEDPSLAGAAPGRVRGPGRGASLPARDNGNIISLTL